MRTATHLATRGSLVVHAVSSIVGRPNLRALVCSNRKFTEGGRERQPGEEPTCRSCIKALRDGKAAWK